MLRVAQSVRRGNRAEIVAFAAERLEGSLGLANPEPEPQTSGACLTEALYRLNLKPGAVVMGIPRGLVFLRTLWLPKPETPAELTAMVYFQINKDLPFRPEEAVIDFQVNDRISPTTPAAAGSPEGAGPGERPAGPAKVEVLVAVVKKEVVRHYQSVAQASGLKLAALGLESYANARGLQACGLAGGPRAVALVSVREEEVLIDVVAGKSLAFSRTASLDRNEALRAGATPKPEAARADDAGPRPFPRPTVRPSPLSASEAIAGAARHAQNGAEPEPGPEADRIELITIEVVRSLHNYGGLERPESVEQVFVTGSGSRGPALAEALARRCGLPCRLLEPVAALGLSLRDSEYRSGALTAFGLALSAQDETPWPFDFLHPKRPPALRNQRRATMIRAAAAAGLLLCALGAVRTHLIHHRLKARDQLQDKITAAAGNRAVYRDVRLRAKTVHDWLQEKREWLDHEAYLSALLPSCPDVYITSFSTGSRGVLHVSIQARTGEILAQLDKRLREAGYDLKPLAVTPCSDKFGYAFQSSLELTLPDKIKMDLASLKVADRPANDGSLEASRPRSGASVAPPAPALEREGSTDSQRKRSQL